MAAIDSTTAGVLTPTAAKGTENPMPALRAWLSELTGIPNTLLRARWMTRPGTMPAIGIDWAAVGVERVETHGTPYQRGRKGESVQKESHQSLHCVVSFYGPNAAEKADIFREGAQVFQNSDALRLNGLTFQSVAADVQHLPDLLGEQWVDRYDVSFVVGRKVVRTYAVRDFSSAGFVIFTDKGML